MIVKEEKLLVADNFSFSLDVFRIHDGISGKGREK